jgi:hypothetical protein
MCKTAVVETTISSEIGGKSSSSGDSVTYRRCDDATTAVTSALIWKNTLNGCV